MRFPTMVTSLMLLAMPLAAQAPAAPPPPPLLDRARAAMALPTLTAELREAGVPDSAVQSLLGMLQRRNLPAPDVRDILTTQRDAVRAHGPTDNFGAFVQARLDQGLRGRALAAAIRTEHAQHGKPKVREARRP